VVGASIGEDAAAIDFGEKYLLAKTDPVTFVAEEDRIPILDECRILCRHYGLDPLGFISSGSLLIMVEPSDSGKIKRSLEEAGVPAAIIGRITGKEEGVKSRSEGRTKDLPRFDRDEITKILQRD
jgi:hydrogenase maturation factor